MTAPHRAPVQAERPGDPVLGQPILAPEVASAQFGEFVSRAVTGDSTVMTDSGGKSHLLGPTASPSHILGASIAKAVNLGVPVDKVSLTRDDKGFTASSDSCDYSEVSVEPVLSKIMLAFSEFIRDERDSAFLRGLTGTCMAMGLAWQTGGSRLAVANLMFTGVSSVMQYARLDAKFKSEQLVSWLQESFEKSQKDSTLGLDDLRSCLLKGEVPESVPLWLGLSLKVLGLLLGLGAAGAACPVIAPEWVRRYFRDSKIVLSDLVNTVWEAAADLVSRSVEAWKAGSLEPLWSEKPREKCIILALETIAGGPSKVPCAPTETGEDVNPSNSAGLKIIEARIRFLQQLMC